MEERESRIRPLTGGAGSRFIVEFSPEEVTVLDEMLGTYGNSRQDVVFRAVSLLYTVFRENPEAKTVFIQRGSKRLAIPLE
jgi:hypothetical protein